MQRRSSPLKAAFYAAVIAIASLTPANASLGGTEAANTPFSIGYTFQLNGSSYVCSGALLSPTVIATAAHCTTDELGNMSSDYVFAAPGVALDAPIDPNAKRPKVTKVFTVPGYKLTATNESDDIAFLQLDMPIATKGFIRVATALEIAGLIDKSPIQGYGVGEVHETNAPYSRFTRVYPMQWSANQGSVKTIQIKSPISSACSGDSGGAVTAKLATGEEVLVAVMSGAAQVVDHCGSQIDGNYLMRATLVNPYSNLVEEILKAPLPSPSPTPTAKKVVKIYKITCIKGKTKKYITGTNPKCPTGYKLTAKVLVKK